MLFAEAAAIRDIVAEVIDDDDDNSTLGVFLQFKDQPSTTPGYMSPVILNTEWSRVIRLLLLVVLSFAGCIGNVFLISSLMIEESLKKRGNSLIANIALADIIVTGIIIPISSVVILADINDSDDSICKVQWYLALVSCYVCLLSIAVLALENFSRLCLPEGCYKCLTTCKITTIIIMIWGSAAAGVTVQIYYGLGPDYCGRLTDGVPPYHLALGLGFIVVPCIIAFIFFSLIPFCSKSEEPPEFDRVPSSYKADYNLSRTNMYNFIICIIFWLPFGLVITFGSVQTISQRVFYNLAWFGLCKACFVNLVYCLTNKFFRSAYISLFHYCFCKTSVNATRRSREQARPLGEVRVHMIPGYNVYSYTSPQRYGEKPKPGVGRWSGENPQNPPKDTKETYQL